MRAKDLLFIYLFIRNLITTRLYKFVVWIRSNWKILLRSLFFVATCSIRWDGKYSFSIISTNPLYEYYSIYYTKLSIL